MVSQILPRLYAERAKAMKAVLEESQEWGPEEAADLVSELESLIEASRTTQERVRFRAFGHSSETIAELRKRRAVFEEVWRHILSSIELFRQAMEKKAGQGNGLAATISRMNELSRSVHGHLACLQEEWPVLNEEETKEALALIGRGEGIPIEQAFAEGKGVSVEEGLRLLEEHKRKYHPDWP